MIQISGQSLSCADVRAAVQRVPVAVSAAGRDRADAAHRAAIAIAAGQSVYGRSTGVGANRDVEIGPDAAARADHGWSLLLSHSGGAGALVEPDRLRAMMVVRLNQLAAGGSGVSPSLLDGLMVALSEGLVPPARRYGSLGTGDLVALATTALCLAGRRPWLTGSRGVVDFDPADALAFISSNALAIGTAAVSVADLTDLLHVGLVVGSLSLLAVGGSMQPFAEAVQDARPHPGQRAAAGALRALLADEVPAQRRIQDPYGYRALPQVQGAALDATAAAERGLVIEMNSASENPVVDPVRGVMLHNGNFHAAHMAVTLDAARAALFQAAALSTARLSTLLEPAYTGLTPFLAGRPGPGSGLMILEYVAQAALADIRLDATPTATGSAVLSRGVEDHASFAAQAAERTADTVAAYQTVLGCELVAAVRALRMAQIVPVGKALRTAFALCGEVLDPGLADRALDGDLAAAADLLARLRPDLVLGGLPLLFEGGDLAC